jgi:hypothetical protein
MPFTSQVGRDQIISSAERSLSPAGFDSPTPPRKAPASKPSASHCAAIASGNSGTPS